MSCSQIISCRVKTTGGAVVVAQSMIEWLQGSGYRGPLPWSEGGRIAGEVGEALGLRLYPRSLALADGVLYALARENDGKRLVVVASEAARLDGFAGQRRNISLSSAQLYVLIGEQDAANAAALRHVFPHLRPQMLGLQPSVGCGDRLGLATPGHIAALRAVEAKTGMRVGLIAAQQSVRENARTGRSPQQVLDDAMWGVFETGWTAGFGADADHLKSPEDLDSWVAAGFTFYTIDPGEHVDDEAERADASLLRRKVEALPWQQLESSPDDLLRRLGKPIDLGSETLQMSDEAVLRAAAKYGAAVAHTVRMYRALVEKLGERAFELEVSVDETAHVTRLEEHVYIAHELRRLGVRWISLAPRYVGAFEKGVDYIGDVEQFCRDFARHVAVARTFGPYKLSLHSGSDKFSIYPAAAEVAGDLLHLKTAGTSYLEALRTVASVNPSLFRDILQFACQRYPIDRATYHVSGRVDRIPDPRLLADSELPELLDQFDARQVLHVTYGSVLQNAGLREGIMAVLRRNEERHYGYLQRHFERHLMPFRQGFAPERER